jgi:membrane-bound lytic murein transglycosylase C
MAKGAAKGEVNQAGIKAGVSQLTNGKKKVAVEVPFNFGYQSTLASRYRNTVVHEAKAHNVSPSLLYAVMETESSFNPRARSAIPAFGLMQLVPRSGGMDAYNHVYGEKVLLDPEYLYDPSRNVELGAAYLNLVYTRYLRHIKDPRSRLYCTIAAYNTGAGNVARTFVGTNSVPQAAKVIDTMTPDEVYEYMRNNLPYEETRRYLEKVTKAQKKFSSLDSMAGVSSNAI